jgi:hypothetical protein
MTKREAAIVGAYTGYLLGDFTDMHEYITEIMERPVFTHELGNEKIREEIKQKAKPDFISIDID